MTENAPISGKRNAVTPPFLLLAALMFVGLKHPVKQGDHVKGTLTFEKAGALEVEYTVESIGAKQPTNAGKEHMQMSPGMQMH